VRYDSIVDTIGGTPLVRLNRLPQAGSATIYAKIESFNPGSSVKDRIGAAMIDAAEREGSLKPGMTIVEPTSGNTGIGLALVAAARGYRCIFTMPETMSTERRALLKFFGAEIVLTPAEGGMKAAIAQADELCRGDGYFQPFQFSNPANPRIHRDTTAREIIDDLGELGLNVFVAGVGTGGTVSGAGAVLKDHFGCRVVAVEPDASPVLSGGAPGPHHIQGIGAGFVPDNFDAEVVDRIMRVTNEDALATARRLAREEGILAGISSGAIIWAACRLAAELGAGKTVVAIVCDTGERYLSTALFDQVR